MGLFLLQHNLFPLLIMQPTHLLSHLRHQRMKIFKGQENDIMDLCLTMHSWWVCWEFCFSCVNTALEIGMFGTWMRGKIVEKRKNTYNDVFYFVWLKLKWKIDRKKFIVLLFCIHRVLAFGCNKITNRWQFGYFWNINDHFYNF